MTGTQLADSSNVQQVTDKLLAKGCNAIILTLGPLGAVYASKANGNVTQIPTTKVHPVDTTVRSPRISVFYARRPGTIAIIGDSASSPVFLTRSRIPRYYSRHFRV